MTDIHIGWIVALAAGAATGLVFTASRHLLDRHRHVAHRSSPGFSIVLGIFGAIMANAGAYLVGLSSSLTLSAAIGLTGATGLLILNRRLNSRRRVWARWYP